MEKNVAKNYVANSEQEGKNQFSKILQFSQ